MSSLFAVQSAGREQRVDTVYAAPHQQAQCARATGCHFCRRARYVANARALHIIAHPAQDTVRLRHENALPNPYEYEIQHLVIAPSLLQVSNAHSLAPVCFACG